MNGTTADECQCRTSRPFVVYPGRPLGNVHNNIAATAAAPSQPTGNKPTEENFTSPPERQAKPIKKAGGVSTAKDLMNMQYSLMNLGPYSKFYGKPGTNVKILLHAEPGVGKTYHAIKFGNWLAKHIGPVLFISAEEYGSPTLSEKLKEIGSISDDLHFTSSLADLSNEYAFIILDSVQALNLTPESLRELIKQYNKAAWLWILQKTKDGNFKGSKEWEHDSDINSKMYFNDAGEREMDVYKNRYQVTGKNLL